MKRETDYNFKGASGATYQFNIYPRGEAPQNISGIFIYAKKLAFKQNNAVFLIPQIIKKSRDMAHTLRNFNLNDHPELNEVDHFCVFELSWGDELCGIYQDLLDQYDEGGLEQKSENI